MFDDERHKINKITSQGQNVDKINIAATSNVCLKENEQHQKMIKKQFSLLFARKCLARFTV
jgi:hypothetical protein